jgi:hypothetical protein
MFYKGSATLGFRLTPMILLATNSTTRPKRDGHRGIFGIGAVAKVFLGPLGPAFLRELQLAL